jgi:Flp pilus assembly protein TadG
MSRLSKYIRNEVGGTAVVMAIAAVPLALAVGIAVDTLRANRVQTVLQGAADSAALAGATSQKSAKKDYSKIVKEYLQANGANDALDSVTKIDSKLNKSDNTFTVWVEGKVDSGFMQMAGINDFDVSAKSVVNLGGQALEVVLVLDNTASMAGSKIGALKDAAKELVDDLMVKKTAAADVKVGVVPFSEYVNVGLGAKTKPWMNVPPETTETKNICGVSYPDATKSNCVTKTGTYSNDGIPTPYTYEECEWNYGTGVTTCADQTWTNKWYGCVGSRTSPLDETIGSMSTPYPGLLNLSCPAEILPLTNSASAVNKAIDSLITTGNTYIPAGLLWGWNMIDANEPISGGYTKKQMTSKEGTKAIVLMTDGFNTLSAAYPYHWGTDTATSNTLTAQLCDNIKDDGIIVYTVAFEVTDAAAKDLLSNCASEASNAFVADDKVALMDSFKTIGESLSKVRLAE